MDLEGSSAKNLVIFPKLHRAFRAAWITFCLRFSYGAAILGSEKAAEWQQALLLLMDAKIGDGRSRDLVTVASEGVFFPLSLKIGYSLESGEVTGNPGRGHAQVLHKNITNPTIEEIQSSPENGNGIPCFVEVIVDPNRSSFDVR